MKLKECKNWRVVHFDDRGIMKKDMVLFSSDQQRCLLNLEVEPMKTRGHYKVKKEE